MLLKVFFKFGLSLNPSVTIENAVNSDGAYNQNGGGIIASALHSAPIFPVYNADGSFLFCTECLESEYPDDTREWFC